MDACSEKTERTYQSSRRNTEAKLFDTFNNKKKSVINIFIMQSEERQQGSFRHNSGTVYIRRPPPLSTVSQQDSQTETLRDKFYIVYLRTACSISWSLLFDMYHLCSRQSLVNRNTKVFIGLHCSLAAL